MKYLLNKINIKTYFLSLSHFDVASSYFKILLINVEKILY